MLTDLTHSALLCSSAGPRITIEINLPGWLQLIIEKEEQKEKGEEGEEEKEEDPMSHCQCVAGQKPQLAKLIRMHQVEFSGRLNTVNIA